MRNKANKLNSAFYVNVNETENVKIYDGDKIIVPRLIKSVNRVEIIGQAMNPGSYKFFEGMMLSDLINLSGGMKDKTFIKSISKRSAEIIRRNPDSKYEKIIPVNISEILNNNYKNDIRLENLDKFVVHANTNFYEKENIQIIGEIAIPGSYPMLSDSETLQSIIDRAGGLSSNALKDGVSIFRQWKYYQNKPETNNTNTNGNFNQNNPFVYEPKIKKIDRARVAWDNKKISVMPGDSIVVSRSTKYNKCKRRSL